MHCYVAVRKVDDGRTQTERLVCIAWIERCELLSSSTISHYYRIRVTYIYSIMLLILHMKKKMFCM